MRFGGGMRFSTQNISNKPPSRQTSKAKKRPSYMRGESQNRLYREDRNTISRGKGSASLARTSGKTNSRLIFQEKTLLSQNLRQQKSTYQESTSLPIGSQYADHNIVSSYKPTISSYYNQYSKPTVTPSIGGMGSYFGNSTSSSNFPQKIAVKRDSTDESTRDDTKFTRSSFSSKYDQPTKGMFII